MAKNCIVDLMEEFTSAKLKTETISKLMLSSEELSDRGKKLCECGTYIGFNFNENENLRIFAGNGFALCAKGGGAFAHILL